jgi:hypothetical protein
MTSPVIASPNRVRMTIFVGYGFGVLGVGLGIELKPELVFRR